MAEQGNDLWPANPDPSYLKYPPKEKPKAPAENRTSVKPTVRINFKREETRLELTVTINF